MRKLTIGMGALAALVTAGAQQADTAPRTPRPYCLDAEKAYDKDCSYYTFQQCLETAHGLNGNCYYNPEILWRQRESGAQPAPPRRARKHSQ